MRLWLAGAACLAAESGFLKDGMDSSSVSGRLYCRLQEARRDPLGEEASKLRRGGRYNEILDFPEELWNGERSGNRTVGMTSVSDDVVDKVYFDWFSLRKATPPPWVQPSDPRAVDVQGSYVDTKSQEVIGEIKELRLEVFATARDSEGYPLAPSTAGGKIGIRGRGVLGQWGPNHAGDAIITRINPNTGKLQVVLVERTDGSNQYAFPGGFVDAGEFTAPIKAIVREFLEEAVGREAAASTTEALYQIFGKFDWDAKTGKVETDASRVKWGRLVHAGYVEDERNTDNAWMETLALNWHLDGELASKLTLHAGDDAAPGSAAFYDVEGDARLTSKGVDPLANLFASHSGMLRKLIRQPHILHNP